jgi:hypothetical protein
MKNTPTDFNDRLLEMMDTLKDKSLEDEKLLLEIKRAITLNAIASNVIKHNVQTLKIALAVANSLADVQLPPMLELTAQKSRKMLEQ